MLRILLGEPTRGVFEGFVDSATARDGMEVIGIARTGRELSGVVREGEVDVLLFPNEWSELCRSIRVSLGVAASETPSFVVGTDQLTRALIVKCMLYGFDGVVPALSDPDTSVETLEGVANGTVKFADEQVVADLGIRTGVLSRELRVNEGRDAEIADLVAAGLPDADIADVLGMSVQFVRNRIEHLLDANDLTHRTQLAVLRASVWKVPDFS